MDDETAGKMCTKNQLHILMEKLNVVRLASNNTGQVPAHLDSFKVHFILLSLVCGAMFVVEIEASFHKLRFATPPGDILCLSVTMSAHGYVGDIHSQWGRRITELKKSAGPM